MELSSSTNKCPCGSGRLYAECCEPLHKSESLASTPEALMRSRYAAFAIGKLGEYLLETWHPSTRPTTSAESMGARDTQWQKLEIVDAVEMGDAGEVEFKAYWLNKGKEHLLHERSRFSREEGRWRYIDGEIFHAGKLRKASPAIVPEGAAGQDMSTGKAGRNDPCPCGSGKKFKKCCGQ
ncbi:YchJ family protein [Pokkaliibacter sp. CJK22405]|uniref:YchJ family protein n=1 Tax=Pokkaliibacter sp. CJK22405 TaxID=3384615 RepID=UPI0039846957